ncbi:thiosulfate sulfurtransferase [Robertmurraya siralis]|uniref:Thiosulfate sulfurtransferase n=1 Tax=Robertmurraya siralis TaxID=77777 RepID=A0A920BSM9_9BACI|nr:sulfurtransferase [Robertmurraya siralis]PAE22220.1 sulfurtransferase [Bacillus sp. 7504-2]GIN60816.1 thiosulfate sulfurtransferase [Robertmurraya siralis]
MKAFISKETLLEKLEDRNIRIVDCRFQLGNPNAGLAQYQENHLPGAVYFHLEKQLSGPVAEHGGRHPLPNIEDFKNTLQGAGISNKTIVVAYDGGEGSFAGRLWWLLKYVGHQECYILDGGFTEWSASNFPVSNESSAYPQTGYDVYLNNDMVADMADVRRAIAENNSLIDSRDTNRYLGVVEPIDKKAGHIPTAINKVWTEGFTDGRFKAKAEQEARFAEFKKDEPIIVYCGSGITATPNYIALKEAGFTNVKLYAGSFSDWISYPENKIVTSE